MLRTILTPYDWSRFDYAPSPPKVLVGRDVAIGIALLMNELATNAVKYGALSNDCGRIILDWSHAGGCGGLLWEERDGPEAKPTDREGFGTRLIHTALLAQGGTVERTFSARGVRCCARFPANEAPADATR